ncbi:hypothetical protein WOSG25_050350 [Weissella oryzae SG25]|uniref:Uncharacterized protein n=1 Tax=Weissella oryzae (strain DSM 25784 / JCM 18191 / LMG 30913 / SG25) TaxID=1329250 RepID=A0A069CU91_WEIOS|nr:hypothetical protein [Weissella oryzae]GAK30763.1 hypothetical protein WOSG25_050350 [Weissella oryzae SG25]
MHKLFVLMYILIAPAVVWFFAYEAVNITGKMSKLDALLGYLQTVIVFLGSFVMKV